MPAASGVSVLCFVFSFLLFFFICSEVVYVSGCQRRAQSSCFFSLFFIVFKVWVSLDASGVSNVRVVDGLWLRLKVPFFECGLVWLTNTN